MLCRKEKKDESLVDYIPRFAEHSYKTNGVDAAEEENKAIITFFIENLFNKDIRRRVASAKNIRTLADAFKSAQHNLLKLKRYEGINYDSNEEEALEGETEEINVIRGYVTPSSNDTEHDTASLALEMAHQIVDLPVSELQTSNENDKGANPSDQNIKQNYSFWGTCSNC